MDTIKIGLRFAFYILPLASFAGPAPKLNANDYFKPAIEYVDGAESFDNPARGCAAGGWTTFKPEGLPGWHGAKDAYNSSLWELSRFSGGREQNGRRPAPERIGGEDIPLTDAMARSVRRFLEETRANGGALIIRIGYTWSEQAGCEPADFNIVLGHVETLSRIMADFDDVIVGVEAGVAGPWAEMHSSDYCKAEYMNRILETYCANLPESISILVRSPGFISKMAGSDTAGVLAKLPFADSKLKRLGMFNDGYLGTWWDYGTWAGDFTRERGVEMLKTFTDHPYGGEFAYVSLEWIETNRERTHELFETDHWNIVKEWYDTHLNYLRNVKDANHSLCKFLGSLSFDSTKFAFAGMPRLAEYDGQTMLKFCLDHMGYRFAVRNARLPKTLHRGKQSLIALDVENTGFGKLLLPSRCEVVFKGGGKTAAAGAKTAHGGFSAIEGGATSRIAIRFTPPKDLPAGTYEIFLRVAAPLKDETPLAIPRRAIRFANKNIWNEDLKANSFGKITVQ